MSNPLKPGSSETWEDNFSDARGCVEGFLGLLVGGFLYAVLMLTDPFHVIAFEEPQNVEIAARHEAYLRWKSSPFVLVGRSVTEWIPFLGAGCVALFVHVIRPSRTRSAFLRVAAVALGFCLVSASGCVALDRLLSTGESSDPITPLAMLGFEALCLYLTAPLASWWIARRPCGVRSASGGSTRSAESTL